MKKLSDADIRKLAKLSKLKLSDKEIDRYREELSNIMSFVEILQEVDASGLEPTSQVTGLEDVLRDDQVIDYKTDPASLLSNAPELENNQIKVKRMI